MSKFFPGRNRRNPVAGLSRDRIFSSSKTSDDSDDIVQSLKNDPCVSAAQNIKEGFLEFQILVSSTGVSDVQEFIGFRDDEIEISKAKAKCQRQNIQNELTNLLEPEINLYYQPIQPPDTSTPKVKKISSDPANFSTVETRLTPETPNVSGKRRKIPNRKFEDYEQPEPSRSRPSSSVSRPSSSLDSRPSSRMSSRSNEAGKVVTTPINSKNKKKTTNFSSQKSTQKVEEKVDSISPTKKLTARQRSKFEKEHQQQKEIEEEELETRPPPLKKAKIVSGPKPLIRPSKLSFGGTMPGYGDKQQPNYANLSAPTFGQLPFQTMTTTANSSSSTPNGLFGVSPAQLIVEGKRQWKPSLKVKENHNNSSVMEHSAPVAVNMKKSITQYADAVASKKSDKSNEDDVLENNEKIQRILASQWDSRLRRVDNKFVKTRRLSGDNQQRDEEEYDEGEEMHQQQKKPLLRESKLELNQGLLQKLRKPSHQIQFYQAIQESMQMPNKTPPKLLNSSTSINPAGTALVEEQSPETPSSSEKVNSKSNRMPGNIVCGICGAVRYYAFILQAKKFGTFSCEPCRGFISKTIRKVKSGNYVNESFSCVKEKGMCVVPPVIRNSSHTPHKKPDVEVRCQACWLKLCLIGYNLDNELYDKLRLVLPNVIQSQLPKGASRSQSQSLVPHRGEILEFNRQVPLSRPLFDGFGEAGNNGGNSVKVAGTANASFGKTQSHIVHERLPNGWTKKAVKRLDGVLKGKWDMFLITPDQKILKSPSDLKLYIAKSGAVIDSNIVNFALPKKTARVDKAIMQSKAEEQIIASKTSPLSSGRKKSSKNNSPTGSGRSSRLDENPDKLEKEKSVVAKGTIQFPKSSRRETKVPLKYRDESPAVTSSSKKNEKKKSSPSKSEMGEDETITDESDYEEDEEHSNLVGSPNKHVYSKIKNNKIKTIGVGTFSIDKGSVKSLPNGNLSDLRFKTSKRTVSCKKCDNCKKDDCKICVYCLDGKKNGGKGNLKKICVERRCMNPHMPGLPALSTFRNNSNETKRNIIRTATAVATKSAPPPPSSPSPFQATSVIPMTSTPKPTSSKKDLEKDDSVNMDISSANTTVVLDDSIVTPSVSRAGSPSLDSTLKSIVVERETSKARPKMSFAALIALALDNLPNKRGTLKMIYYYLEERFPYFKDSESLQWQNSIRHNLSMHKDLFLRGKKEGKGSYWSMLPGVDKAAVIKKKSFRDDSKNSKLEDVPEAANISTNANNRVTVNPKNLNEFIIVNNPTTTTATSTTTTTTSIPVIVKPQEEKKTEELDQIQSLEEFLEIGTASKSSLIDKNISLMTALDIPARASPRIVVEEQQLAEVVVPTPPTLKVSAFKSAPPPPPPSTSTSQTLKQPYLGSMDYWEQYDPEEVEQNGYAVITTKEISAAEKGACFMCGSCGQEEMLRCNTCCEPYHPFCIQQEDLPQTAELEKEWICSKCSTCEICGNAGNSQLRCHDCNKAFHRDCLETNQKVQLGGAPAWSCFRCLRCKSCGNAAVSHYLDGVPFCSTCCLQKKQGSYCPICEGCYDDNDYDARMMECGKCGGWVHAKCEGVDAEKYQVLSYLPDTVEFVCKKCHPGPDEPDWMHAVLEEVRHGEELVVLKLIDSKWARPLTHSPVKNRQHQDLPVNNINKSNCISKIKRLKEHHHITDCSVKLKKLILPPEVFVRAKRYSPPTMDNDVQVKDCVVKLKDLKYHSWWGPKVRHLSTESKIEFEEQEQEQQEEQNLYGLHSLKEKVGSRDNLSVLSFHLEVRRILENAEFTGPFGQIRKDNFWNDYTMAMKEVFPWFDAKNPTTFFEPLTVEDSCVKPPFSDHFYADSSLKENRNAGASDKKKNPPKWKYSKNSWKMNVKDDRTCLFCQVTGDRQPCKQGRLIYFRQNEWVHVNCALWSSEVYEEIDGSLQNVDKALSRGLKLNCTLCSEKGATTGCCQSQCDCNYHFLCGLKDGAVYKEDKTVYCHKHKERQEKKSDTKDFRVRRTVYVDLTESKRKQKMIDLRKVKLKIGSLDVEMLGDLHADSDHSLGLVPVGFTCSRIFWSSFDPSRLVKYLCRTKLSKRSSDTKSASAAPEEDDMHVVINHEKDQNFDRLKEFRKKLKQLELNRARRGPILPPFAVKQVWKNLSLEDLHLTDLDSNTNSTSAKCKTSSTESQKDCTQSNPALLENNIFLSPTKRLNKAVGNVMKRTPTKAIEETTDFVDLSLDDSVGGVFPLEEAVVAAADNDLISAILRDENFEQELEKSGLGHQKLDSQECAMKKSTTSYCDATVMRTWFNQNKKKKFTEVSTQCSFPFETHVFDMDIDYSDLLQPNDENDVESEVFDYEMEEDDQELSEEDDLLNYVAGINPIEDDDDEVPATLNELDLLNRILAMSGDKMFELGNEEQVFELNSSGSELKLKFPTADKENDSPKENIAQPLNSEQLIQLDGTDDSDILQQPTQAPLLMEDLEAEIPPLIVQPNPNPSMPDLDQPLTAEPEPNPNVIKTKVEQRATEIGLAISEKSTRADRARNSSGSVSGGRLTPGQVTAKEILGKMDAESYKAASSMSEKQTVFVKSRNSSGGSDLGGRLTPGQLVAKEILEKLDEESNKQSSEQVKEKIEPEPSKPITTITSLPQLTRQISEITATESNQSSQSNEASPNKRDFSIAGILSPTAEASANVLTAKKESIEPPKDNDDDDDIQEIIVISKSKPKKPSATPRKLFPKVSSSMAPSLSSVSVANTFISQSPRPIAPPPVSNTPPVYIQQFASPEMATSFAQNFQQNTGRSLQYVTSINAMQPLGSPGNAPMLPYHQQPLMQPISSSFTSPGYAQGFMQPHAQLQMASQGFISTLPAQQFTYVTPQGIILNQASPNFFQIGNPYSPYNTMQPPQSGMLLNPMAASASSPAPTYMTPSTPSLTAGFSQFSKPIVSQTSSAFSPASTTTTSSTGSTPKKIARVQPQPSRRLEKTALSSSSTSGAAAAAAQTNTTRLDPIKALSNMASHPMATTASSAAQNMSITHSPLVIQQHQQQPMNHINKPNELISEIDVTNWNRTGVSPTTLYRPQVKRTIAHPDNNQRSVGTQARIGAPLKIITPRPWKGSEQRTPEIQTPKLLSTPVGPASSGVSAEDESSNASSVGVISRPESLDPNSFESKQPLKKLSQPQESEHSYGERAIVKGMAVTKKRSHSNSIKLVLQRSALEEPYKIQEMSIKDASKSGKALEPETAIRALKVKARLSRKTRVERKTAFVAKLDGSGLVSQTQENFVNEQMANLPSPSPSIWRPADMVKQEPKSDEDESVDEDDTKVVYELTSEDGFVAESTNPTELWQKVFEAVQEARDLHNKSPLAFNPLGQTGLQMLGLTHNALAYLLEQLPGARNIERGPFKRGQDVEEVLKENPTGCVRTECFKNRSPLDMFSWLASRHRKLPDPRINQTGNNSSMDTDVQLSSNRRATSLELPMAMRFRHLAKNAKEAVGVFSSGIHGRGLYCKREIQIGEMVIEYAGEEIRAMLTDKREKLYEAKGIGCYMFKIDDDTVIDATMKGNAARFINHSCDPNCYSKIVDILGKKHIIIFAMRKIQPGEELTYDYKFPIEDVKIPCNCGTKRCKKYMN